MATTSIFEEEERPKLDKKALQSDILYYLTKGVGGAFLKTFTKLQIEGEENIPLIGKAILTTISKNPIRDMLIISQITGRKVHFMINHKLMKQKVIGPALKSIGMFRSTMNKDDTEPIDKVFEILNEKGNLVAMTPEAKYDREIQIKSIAGIIKFAIAAKAPIIPLAVVEVSNKLFNLIPSLGFVVKVGTPLKIERKLNRDKYRNERYRLAEEILGIIENLRNSIKNREEVNKK
ncbi:MAG: lysophospholipid acyltransferase family protein [Promethearchaeota archaeon]